MYTLYYHDCYDDVKHIYYSDHELYLLGLSLQYYYSLSFIIEQAMKDFKLQLIRAQTFQSLQVVAIGFQG